MHGLPTGRQVLDNVPVPREVERRRELDRSDEQKVVGLFRLRAAGEAYCTGDAVGATRPGPFAQQLVPVAPAPAGGWAAAVEVPSAFATTPSIIVEPANKAAALTESPAQAPPKRTSASGWEPHVYRPVRRLEDQILRLASGLGWRPRSLFGDSPTSGGTPSQILTWLTKTKSCLVSLRWNEI